MISLHSIKFVWTGGYELEIISSDTQPSTDAFLPWQLPIFKSAQLSASQPSQVLPSISYFEDPDGFYEPLRLRENAEYLLLIRVPLTFNVAQAKIQQIDSTWPFVNPRLKSVIKIFPARLWQRTQPDGLGVTILGAVNFGSYVGTVDLSIQEPGSLLVEVASSKIGYFDDFKLLLNDVADEIIDLILQVDSVSGYKLDLQDVQKVSTSIILFHLRRLMASNRLPLAIETITQQPYNTLQETIRDISPATSFRIDPAQIASSASSLTFIPEGPLADIFLGKSPIEIPERVKHDTIDNPENRYVKNFLVELSILCDQLKPVLAKEKKQASLREVTEWQNLVDTWRSWSGWRGVGTLTHLPSNSQVLLRRNGYKDVLEVDLTLQYGLQLPWERGVEIAETIADIRPIYEIYEYWCYFALRRALRNVCGLERKHPNSLLVIREGKLEVNLRRGKLSRVDFTFIGSDSPYIVSLFYNRKFHMGQVTGEFDDGSYSVDFRPDYSVLFNGQGSKHWFHFDAKYRLSNIQEWIGQSPTDLLDDMEQELDDGPQNTFKQNDLYKMHTYRDALLGSRGAYVLFPGSGVESLFVRHPESTYRTRFNIPSIGAFPLKPQIHEIQINVLGQFFKRIFSTLADADVTYQDESGILISPNNHG